MNNADFINSLKNNLSALTYNEAHITGETNDFDKFLKDLSLMGYGFVVSKSVKYEGDNSKYRFTLDRGDIPIRFMGYPFLIKQHVYYECVNGPQQKHNFITSDHLNSTKKRFHLNCKKKFNCKAVMIMVKLSYFPEYEITESSLTKWRVKKKVLTNLKKDVDTGKQISIKDKYLILISLPSIHNHAIEASLVNLPTDKSILNEISRLVNNGFTNVETVQSMLNDFVKKSCTKIPSNLSRAFFPDKKTIRNVILKFTYETKKGEIYQNALSTKLGPKSQSNDELYFQTFGEEDEIIKPLLSTEWQKHFLDQYDSVCLLGEDGQNEESIQITENDPTVLYDANENFNSVASSYTTRDVAPTVSVRYRELLRKMIDLSYSIDEKQHLELSKELDVLSHVHDKMSEMVKNKDGSSLLPFKRSSTVLSDRLKNHKRPKKTQETKTSFVSAL